MLRNDLDIRAIASPVGGGVIRSGVFQMLTIVVVMVAFIIVGSDSAGGQSPSPDVSWQVGNELEKSNLNALSVWWADAPIRDRLTSFSVHQKLALFLDRRVDPSLEVSTGINNGTTEQFLWGVAGGSGIGVSRIADFYYFGPAEMAAALPIAWDDLRKESSKHKRDFKISWNAREKVQTNSPVQPKVFLQQLARDNQFAIKNLDALPHDVWSGFQLPPTTLEGRVAMILVGFDKWFTRSPDGTVITIIDFPKFETGKIVLSDLTDARKKVRQLRREFPDLKLSANGKTRISATGAPLELARLNQDRVEAQTAVLNSNSVSTFDLNKTKALRITILQRIADQTNHPLILPTPLPPSLSELVELNVKGVYLGELIQEVLKGSDLKFDLNPGNITISEK